MGEELQKEQWNKDLEAFGVHERSPNSKASKVEKKRPRVVYIDLEELEIVFRKSVDNWNHGEFRHLHFHRVMLMKKPFRSWKRILQCPWILAGDHDSSASPASSRTGATPSPDPRLKS